MTGASRGIGRATALALAAQGWRVVVAARSAGRLEGTAQAIRAQGGVAEAVVADLSSDIDVARLFGQAHRSEGTLRLLVNNAATLTRVPFKDLTVEELDRTLAVNLRGAVLCARAAFAEMAEGGGCIVNIASLAGVAGVEKFPGLSAYVVSKFGMVGLTEALAVEGRPYNIRAVGLAPGAVDTELLRRALPDLRAGVSPEEIARLILFLASDAAAPLNGLTLPLFSNL